MLEEEDGLIVYSKEGTETDPVVVEWCLTFGYLVFDISIDKHLTTTTSTLLSAFHWVDIINMDG